jgi:hypothetical protein
LPPSNFHEATAANTCRRCCLTYLIISTGKKECDVFYSDDD